MCQQPKHSRHTLKVRNSQSLTVPPTSSPQASHPTFGVASGGEDCARRAEKVREVTGKTFHLLLRCLPTGEERCVAGSTSALTPRQPAREEPGRGGVCAGGERGSLSAAQGAMTASLFRSRRRRQAGKAGRQADWLAAGSGETARRALGVSAQRFRVGGPLRVCVLWLFE